MLKRSLYCSTITAMLLSTASVAHNHHTYLPITRLLSQTTHHSPVQGSGDTVQLTTTGTYNDEEILMYTTGDQSTCPAYSPAPTPNANDISAIGLQAGTYSLNITNLNAWWAVNVGGDPTQSTASNKGYCTYFTVGTGGSACTLTTIIHVDNLDQFDWPIQDYSTTCNA